MRLPWKTSRLVAPPETRQTATCQNTNCLTQGVHPNALSSLSRRENSPIPFIPIALFLSPSLQFISTKSLLLKVKEFFFMASSAVSSGATPNAPDRVTDNAAVGRCIRAQQYAFKKADDEGESDFHAETAGNRAFIRSMPPLTGPSNIRDFVACVTYALLTGVIPHRDSTHLLAAAKVALAVVRCESKPAGSGLKPPASEP